MTVLVHGREAYETAVEASNLLFGKATKESLLHLDEATLLSVFEGVPQYELPTATIIGAKAVDLLAETTDCFPSKGEFRKMVKGGGVSINKEKIADTEYTFSDSDLIGNKYLLGQKGKKNYYLFIAK